MTPGRFLILAYVILGIVPPSPRLCSVNAEDGGNGGDDYYNADDGDDYYNADDYNEYNYNNNGDDAAAAADDYYGGDDDDAAAASDDDGSAAAADDDSIAYWSDYAVFPRRCITYNDVDMIMFSVYENGYKQCSDQPMDTYVVPVPTYVSAYLDQAEADAYDMGADDYQTPDSAQFTSCIEIDDGVYVRLGCAEGNAQALAAIIYSDYQCTTRDESYNDEDVSIDISDLEIPMKECQACVTWSDKNDDEVDDQYYENKRTNAPLCSTLWSYKESCDRSCQRIGRERIFISQEGWNTSDKALLAILGLFGVGMLVGILKRRRTMTNKEILLEQAAMTTAGLKQWHVVGIFFLVIIIIVVFALLGLKSMTWALLLLTNMVLFAYLMKLTIDSGMNSPVVGSNAAVIGTQLSADYSEASNMPHNLPQLT